jgi:hypothetical protein
VWSSIVNKYRRQILFASIILLAILFAFPLRGFVYYNLITPFSFIWFYLVYFYHVIPQQFYWFIILLVAAYIALGGLLGKPFRRKKKTLVKRQVRGSVESLASWINDSRRGVYSRWRVARSLALMASSILELRGGKSGRIKVLKGKEWNPPPDVQNYLEAGLNGSFADYPLSARKTPFDVDLENIVAFLESQLEMNRGNNK